MAGGEPGVCGGGAGGARRQEGVGAPCHMFFVLFVIELLLIGLIVQP